VIRTVVQLGAGSHDTFGLFYELLTSRGFANCGCLQLAVALVQHAEASLTSDSNPNVRRVPYVQIDVFSSHRLQGNPLCVFTHASGLNDVEMQDLARETNLQETTFVFPRDRTIQAREGVKVRIFTRPEEGGPKPPLPWTLYP
jgi:hypothetical protein